MNDIYLKNIYFYILQVRLLRIQIPLKIGLSFTLLRKY
jgi:hypothetical protein